MDRLGWAVTVPVRAGDYVLGVRCSSDALARVLQQLFPDRYVPTAEPPANLSVFLAAAAGDGAQEVHRLYRNCGRLVRTRSVRRVFETLWHELDAHDVRAAGRVVLVDVLALVRDGEAYLIPRRYRRDVVDDERRWTRDGFRRVDRRWLEFDAATGTVTVPSTDLPVDDILASIASKLGVEHRAEPPTPAGTFPIRSWVLSGRRLSPAGRLMTATTLLLDRHQHVDVQLMGQMADLVERLPSLDQGYAKTEELRIRLASL